MSTYFNAVGFFLLLIGAGLSAVSLRIDSSDGVVIYRATDFYVGLIIMLAGVFTLFFLSIGMSIGKKQNPSNSFTDSEEELGDEEQRAKSVASVSWTVVNVFASFDGDYWDGLAVFRNSQGNNIVLPFSDTRNQAEDWFALKPGQKVSFRYTSEDQDEEDSNYTASCFLVLVPHPELSQD